MKPKRKKKKPLAIACPPAGHAQLRALLEALGYRVRVEK